MKKNLSDELMTNPSILSVDCWEHSAKAVNHASSVLFICAMPEELEGFRKALEFLGITYCAIHFKYGYYLSFKYNNHCCSAMAVGITFFNTGRLAKCMLQGEYDEVICFGTCAGIAGQPVGEVIVSNNVRCNDLYLSNFGYIDGTISKKLPASVGPLMVSGSKFLSSKKEKEKVKARFPGASTFDMESYLFVQFFKELGIPFICMKAVSDNGEESPEGSFEENVTYVSSISAVFALKFIEKCSVKTLLSGIKEGDK